MNDSISLLDMSDGNGEFLVAGTNWYLDARLPRQMAVVTHAHSDHLGRHARVVATPMTCDLLTHRLGGPGEIGAEQNTPALKANGVDVVQTALVPLKYGEVFHEDGVSVDLFPAGHVLGSAMARVTTGRGRLLYTGDFRWKRDAVTVPACELPADGADVVLMECTYGLPRYRFPERSEMVEKLCDVVAAAQAEGKQPVCLCYSLGKAQEIGRVLCDNGFAVSMHGAAHSITQIYHRHGTRVGDVRAYEPGGIEGTVLIAPPHIRNSRMITGIKNAEIIVITGWALDTSAKYRYQGSMRFRFPIMRILTS